MKTLHLITSNEIPRAFIITKGPNDAIVLLSEGVYLPMKELTFTNLASEIYIIKEDLELRGVENISEAVKPISYADLVSLVFHFDRNITW